MVFDITSLWKRRPDRLGLDFDQRSMRIVRLKRASESTFSLASCGHLAVSVRQATPLDQQRIGAFIRQTGGGLMRAAVNIEDPSLRIRRMSFAKMPERDLIEAIKWNFREHIDCPIEEYEVGYAQIDGWGEADRFTCSAFGVAKKAVKEYAELMRRIGIKLVSLEPQATALLAAFDYNINWVPKEAVVCICLGDFTSHFTVMAEGQLLFSRPMPQVSFEALKRYISRDLNLDESGAEDILFSNLTGAETDVALRPELAETMSSFFSQLVVETQRSIDAFAILFGVERVDSIYLCGIGAYCPGIVAHMQKSLGVKTQIFDPFANISTEGIDPSVKGRSALFAAAFGLAIP